METMHNVGDCRPVRFDDGRTLASKASIKVLGIQADAKGSTAVAIQARESVVMLVWFKHRAQLCCS